MTIRFLKESHFTYPNVYCIRVSGIVQSKIKDYFQIIEIAEVEESKDDKKESVLLVRMRDQAELIGLINLLYNWQHNLISIQLEKVNTN